MLGFLLLCISLSVAQCVVHKTRRVVEFTIDDYYPGGKPIQTLEGLTRNKCMSTGSCSAFNFRSEDDLCMLHSAYTRTECMAENFTGGLEYVHMTDTSNGVTPWQGVRIKEYHKYWKVNPATRTGIPFVKSNLGVKRHMARVNYKGLYLPGYTGGFNKRFKMATPDGIRHTFEHCRRMVQYLVFKNSSYFNGKCFMLIGLFLQTLSPGDTGQMVHLCILRLQHVKGDTDTMSICMPSTERLTHRLIHKTKLCILLDMSTQLSEPTRNRCWCMLLMFVIDNPWICWKNDKPGIWFTWYFMNHSTWYKSDEIFILNPTATLLHVYGVSNWSNCLNVQEDNIYMDGTVWLEGIIKKRCHIIWVLTSCY